MKHVFNPVKRDTGFEAAQTICHAQTKKSCQHFSGEGLHIVHSVLRPTSMCLKYSDFLQITFNIDTVHSCYKKCVCTEEHVCVFGEDGH